MCWFHNMELVPVQPDGAHLLHPWGLPSLSGDRHELPLPSPPYDSSLKHCSTNCLPWFMKRQWCSETAYPEPGSMSCVKEADKAEIMNFILTGMLLTTYHRKSFYVSFLQLVMTNLPFTHSVNISGSFSVGSDLPLVFRFFFTCSRSLSVG